MVKQLILKDKPSKPKIPKVPNEKQILEKIMELESKRLSIPKYPSQQRARIEIEIMDGLNECYKMLEMMEKGKEKNE